MGQWARVSQHGRGFWLSHLEETQLLPLVSLLSTFLSVSVPGNSQDLSDLITPEDTRVGDTSVEEAVATYGDMVKEIEKPLIKHTFHKEKGCPASRAIQDQKERGTSPLMVFVSFSMSDQDLKSLYHEVQKVGGRLVIKGLHQNSWKSTAHKLQELKITVDIDPEAFDRYHVTTVPQFVLQGAEDTVYDALKGNVSLGFAVETFSQQGTLKEEALRLLKKIRVS